MALNQDYFASIHLELIKWKYYSASKVDALLADIRQQVQALNIENETLRRQVEAQNQNSRRSEVNEAVLAAQAMYREIVTKAQTRAGQIVADAERRRAELEAVNTQQQERTVQQVQDFYSRVRQQHVSSIEALDNEWQNFLCNLYAEDEPADSVPADMAQKVGAIASEMRAIGVQETGANYAPTMF